MIPKHPKTEIQPDVSAEEFLAIGALALTFNVLLKDNERAALLGLLHGSKPGSSEEETQRFGIMFATARAETREDGPPTRDDELYGVLVHARAAAESVK